MIKVYTPTELKLKIAEAYRNGKYEEAIIFEQRLAELLMVSSL